MSKQQELLSIVKRNQSWEMQRFMNNNPTVPYSDILDAKSQTLLHIACQNSNYDIVQKFLKIYDQRAKKDPAEYNQQRKARWINLKDFEGFSCLHYAVFKGNYKLALLLQSHGADIYQVNGLGLCVMHIAAQGDSPLLLFYYMSKGFKIQVEDSKGSTPLHWACYSGSESAVNALMAWEAEIDCQDKIYGLTPLHLAVLSGNGKIVKKLLIRGANRKIKDFRDKLPLDLALENEYSNIANMIQDKFGCAEFYNLKQPFRKTSKYSAPFILIIILFATTFIFNCAFVITTISDPINIAYIVLTLLSLMCLILSTCSDPGFLRNKNPSIHNLFEIMRMNQSNRICFDCQIVKPIRSRHCDVCASCIVVYDHHCPWINNCVGAKNYVWFFLFILTTQISLVLTFIYELYELTENIKWQASPLCILHTFTVLYTMVVTLFAIPLIVLIVVQIQNCFRNQTTYERYGGASKISQRTTKQSNQTSNSMQVALDDTSNQVRRKSGVTNSDQNSRRASSNSLAIEQPLMVKEQPRPKLMANCLDMCFRNRNNQSYIA